MSFFTYQSIDETGAVFKGVIEADSVAMAESIIFNKGYIPTQITAQGAQSNLSLWEWLEGSFGKVEARYLIIFTKQFRSMLHAGVPVLRLLQVLESQTENKVLKKTIARMAVDIKEGATLHEAMERHPAVFSTLYRSMVRAGEMSGALPEVLSRLVYIIEHETKIRSDIKSALQYPKMVVMALTGAFFFLLTFVIPKFMAIFAKAGLALPLPTKIAMNMYLFLSGYWYILLAAVVGVIWGLRAYIKTEAGLFAKDAFLLQLPLFGPLFQKAAMSRFASIFAILHASGVPVMTSMSIMAEVIGNAAIAREFERVRKQMEGGQGIAAPLGSAKYFTPMVVDMVAIGEESGNIEDMLREIAFHYDDEVGYAVRGLSDAIGPVLIVCLAAVVGFFALAIFMPMWDLAKLAK